MTEPVLTVRGEARREGPPDLASLVLLASRTGADTDAVRAELAAVSGDIRQLLTSREATLERWSTGGLWVHPVFRQKGTRITGYQGQLRTIVEVEDLTSLGDLVTAIGELSGVGVHGPNWSLRPDNPMFREARIAAISDARERAEDYAAAIGGTVGSVLEISDLEPGDRFGYAPMSVARGGGADDQILDLEPTPQEAVGQVTVRYTLVVPG